MKAKKTLRVALSLGILLYFSAITLSLDFFHHHTSETVCHGDGQHSKCTHKSHISQDSSCWVCAAHFQKEAIQPSFCNTTKTTAPFIRILVSNKIDGYTSERLILSLRGPPVH